MGSLATPRRQHEQIVAGFNLYRTKGVSEHLDDVHVAACYRGLVVEGPARVVRADGDEVVMEVGEEQAKAFSETHLAFVESPVHGTSFRAWVKSLTPDVSEIALSRFVPFKAYLKRRLKPRVTPIHAMLARLSAGDAEVCGRVVDISTDALAMVVNREAVESLLGSEPVLALDVWGEDGASQPLSDFTATGRIVRTEAPEDVGRGQAKVVVGLDLYPALERALKRYVARREREILVSLEMSVPRH